MNQVFTRKPALAWRLVYFGLGLVVLYFLLRQIEFGDLVSLILTIKPQYLLLGALIYLGKGVLRSVRLARLNTRLGMRFIKILRLTFASSLASQLLPMKLGEFSYVYLLREKDATLSQGFSSLMVLRLMDMLAISLLFLLISLGARLPAEFPGYFRSILIFFGLLLAGLIGILLLSRQDVAVVALLGRLRPVERISVLKRSVNALGNFLSSLKQYRPFTMIEGILLALLEWLVNYLVFHVILFGFGMAPSFYATVVSVTFAALASVLPINSFGNFGTQEAGWATGMILMGLSKELAITSGFATHLLTLAYMLVFGGLSWLSYLWMTLRRTGQPLAEERKV